MTAAIHKPLVTFHFRLHLTSQSHGRLPEYKNSMLLGILAREFRSNVCPNMKLSCKDCPFLDNCPYSALFKSPKTSAGVFNHGQPVPYPYLINSDSRAVEFAPGDPLVFDFLLFGNKVEKYIPQLFRVFQNIPSYRLGKDQMRFRIEHVKQETPNKSLNIMDKEAIYHPETVPWMFSVPERYDKIFIQFATPFRSRKEGRLVREFIPEVFFEQVRHRFIQLQMLDYGEQEVLKLPKLPDVNSVRVHHSGWKDIPCYSSTNQRKTMLGGVLASFHMNRSENLDAWLPILLFGEKYHIGKAVMFGFGKYSLWIKR
jgi:hypothetical protein